MAPSRSNGLPAMILSVLVVLVEFIWMQIRIHAEVLYSVYLSFVPPEEKSVVGEVVLVSGQK